MTSPQEKPFHLSSSELENVKLIFNRIFRGQAAASWQSYPARIKEISEKIQAINAIEECLERREEYRERRPSSMKLLKPKR